MPPATFRQLLHEARQCLTKAGHDTPALDARLLMEKASKLNHSELIQCAENYPEPQIQARFTAYVERRRLHEPIAYILGQKGFWKNDFLVTPDTLIPRADSEILVEIALENLPNDRPVRLLDLGTGSGCLLLSLLGERPNATGLGIDKSFPTLQIAKINANRLGLSDRADFLCTDWTQALTSQFDIIISNPPYINALDMAMLAPQIKNYEPQAALYGGEDGLREYRKLSASLLPYLHKKGTLILEIDSQSELEVGVILKQDGWRSIEIYNDLNGLPRSISAKKL